MTCSAVSIVVMSWIQVVVAFGLALIPAGFSAYFASRARAADNQSARLRELDARTAERKYATYEPMLKVLGDALTKGRSDSAAEGMAKVVPEFMTLVCMLGSDDVVQAFFRFQKASGADAPSEITFRLVADFLVAVRRDIAVPDTRITGTELMGMRITDFYDRQDWPGVFNDDFDDVCKRLGWAPPWGSSSSSNSDSKPRRRES